MHFPARVRAAALAALTLIVAACSDGRDISSLTGVRRSANAEGETLDQQITALIPQLWAPSTNTAPAITSWWVTLKQKVARNDPAAAQMLLDLTHLIQGRTDRITPRPGETKEQSAAHLVLLMSLYVHAGPSTPPPDVTPEAEATLAVVSPTEEETVQTPSEEAGVIFPAASVNTPTIVVITKTDESEFPQQCAGPLPTTRCQYPAFYKFDVFPDVKLNSPALVAICREEAATTKLPRGDHDRFRLAHQKPTDPAAYHPEGVIEGDIEILPMQRAENLIECPHEDGGEEPELGALPPGASFIERFAAKASRSVRRLAFGARRAATPKLLYAIDRGGGGSVFMFSDFVMIDPQSQADLYVAGYFSATASTVARGGTVDVDINGKSNDGTGPAGPHTDRILLAQNAGLSEGVIELGEITSTGLNPDLPQGITARVTIPESTPAGSYFIGVRLDANENVFELDETNNVASIPITVGDPNTLFCSDGPEGSYASLQDAVNAAAPGGTVLVCNGLHRATEVVINKPLTLRSQNPGGATLAHTTDVTTSSATNQGAPAILRITGIASGLVRIEDLSFQLRGRGIVTPPTGGSYDQVQIHNTQWTTDPEIPEQIAIMPDDSPIAGAKVEVTEAVMDRMGIGVFAVGAVETNVRDSEFRNFAAGAVIYSGNTGFGTAEDNYFRNCGAAGCIRLLSGGGGPITIRGNTLEAGTQQVSLGAIVVQPIPGTFPVHLHTVEDNTIVSSRTEGPADAAAGYMFANGILVVDGSSVSHVVRNNRIDEAFTGIQIQGNVTATDNVVRNGFYAVQQPGARVSMVNRNDFTGNARWFVWNEGANFQCNWWGTNDAPPAGAVNPASTPPSAYNPRATGPIANTTNACTTGGVDAVGPTHLFSFAANGANADLGGGTGSLLGGAALVNGKLALNGVSAYQQLNQRLVPLSGSFTVEMFARQSTPQNDFIELISQGVSGSGFYLGHDPSRLIRASDAWIATGIGFPNDGLEHHYAVSYDAPTNMSRLYIDGTEVASRVGTMTRGPTGNLTRFGRQYDPSLEFFAGELDNVGIHGSALFPSDIQRLASRAPDTACSSEGPLVSGAGLASTIVFENRTGEAIRVEWLDFTGQRVLYATLPNGASYAQSTFHSHPWIITGQSSSHCYGIWFPVKKGRIVTILPSD